MSLPTCPTCVYAKGICKKTGVEIRTTTGCTYHTPKPITNYDRLRAKSVEEMAFELAMSGCPKPHFVKDNEFVDCPAEREPSKADCVACWLDWLKQEGAE